MSKWQLIQAVCVKSVNPEWDNAKKEWKLVSIFFSETMATCACGHYPIKELCIIRNQFNRVELVVGNCCVRKFLNLPSARLFDAVGRVRDDPMRSLNAETLRYAYQRGWIDDWELGFYGNILRKRKLTEKQAQQKSRINKRISQAITISGSL